MRIHKAATLDQLLHGPAPKVAGHMEYGHKTGATIVLVSQGQHAAIKAATDRKGQSSILRKSAPAGGRRQ